MVRAAEASIATEPRLAAGADIRAEVRTPVAALRLLLLLQTALRRVSEDGAFQWAAPTRQVAAEH